MKNRVASSEAREMSTHQLIGILEKAVVAFRIRMESGITIPSYDYDAATVDAVACILMERGY